MNRIGTLPRLVLLTPFVLLALLLPSSASAAATCAFDSAAAKLTVNMSGTDDTVLRRSGNAIQVDGVACGAATVTNTDTIEVTGGLGAQRVIVELAGGQLAPGKTAEAGSTSEIEIVVDGATGNEFPLGDEVAGQGHQLRELPALRRGRHRPQRRRRRRRHADPRRARGRRRLRRRRRPRRHGRHHPAAPARRRRQRPTSRAATSPTTSTAAPATTPSSAAAAATPSPRARRPTAPTARRRLLALRPARLLRPQRRP